MPDIFVEKKDVEPETVPEPKTSQPQKKTEELGSVLPEDASPAVAEPTPPHDATPPPPPPFPWSEKHRETITMLEGEVRTPGILSAYAPRPDGITFEDQEAHEEILLFVRRHFLTNVPWITTALALFLAPLVLPLIFSDRIFAPITENVSGPFAMVVLALYYLMVIGFALNQFVTWFYQVGIVTNIRVIDIDFNSLLSRNIAYTDLTDVVDTEAHQSGVLQGIYNFGNVGVQTAGMKANFEFTNIPRPNKVVDLISDLMRDIKKHG